MTQCVKTSWLLEIRILIITKAEKVKNDYIIDAKRVAMTSSLKDSNSGKQSDNSSRWQSYQNIQFLLVLRIAR